MRPLDQVYAQALEGGGMPPEAPPAPPQAQPPKDVNPMTQQGDVFFLDPALFGEGHKCKVGDEVTLKAKVQSKGSKYGLVPLEIVAELPEEGVDDSENGYES